MPVPPTSQSDTDLFGNPIPEFPKVIDPQPCWRCGSHHYQVEPGVGPHAALLRCIVCGTGDRWLSKLEAEVVNDRKGTFHE